MFTNVLVSSFYPFPTITLYLPSKTHIHAIPSLVSEKHASFPDSNDIRISLLSGSTPDISTTLGDLNADHVLIQVTPRIRGGKGGFGSQLRAAGGRMSSQKTNNNDSCRDLSGRRLSTVKEAKKIAAYLESEPERQKAASEARKAKIQALERKLGINPDGETEGPSTGSKRRLDDLEYLEQSREIVDSVKNAVTAGLLKKRKKAKISSSPPVPESAANSNASPSKTDAAESSIETPAITATPAVVDAQA